MRTVALIGVQKFGPELTKRTEKNLRRASLTWHVDKTYIRVGGKWRYLWRIVDANGQIVHILTAFVISLESGVTIESRVILRPSNVATFIKSIRAFWVNPIHHPAFSRRMIQRL